MINFKERCGYNSKEYYFCADSNKIVYELEIFDMFMLIDPYTTVATKNKKTCKWMVDPPLKDGLYSRRENGMHMYPYMW